MSRRGRHAALPPADHSRPEPLGADGLRVHHYNTQSRCKTFDFSTLPVAEPAQRSLATLFAARCLRGWTVHRTSVTHWRQVRAFAAFLSEQEPPPRDLDEITAAAVKRWWVLLGKTRGGRDMFRNVAGLLRADTRLQAGPVAEALARRVGQLPGRRQSYSEADFDRVRVEARRMFRAALGRIEGNARHLGRWGNGEFPQDSREWVVGEALDVLARTGTLPQPVSAAGHRRIERRYERALGGRSAEATWQRLFLSRLEATALAVLLMAEFGWNLAVISTLPAPPAGPDPGLDGHPTYRIEVEKRRRGAGRHFETENVTDSGAGSPGRLVTQALQATRFARALACALEPGTDRLVVWRAHAPDRPVDNEERRAVGPLRLGITPDDGTVWGRKAGTGGSPFQRGRRTVLAAERREAAQHTQETHERQYCLPDPRVQAEAVPVIAAGAAAAVRQARATVRLVAERRDTRDPGHAETATADCSGTAGSPAPAPGGGCSASFLLCLACENARVHADHHPRLAHLHQALAHARSALPPARWDQDWGDAHARLDDLRNTIGEGGWRHALARVTDTDREIIESLLSGDLNP